MMKKQFLIYVLAVTAFSLSACHEKEVIVPLSIMTSDLEYGAQGGSGSITFLSTLPVSVTADSPWIKWTATDNKISLQVEANPSTEDRQSHLHLQTENEQKDLLISQSGYVFQHTIESFTCSNDGITKSFVVRTNVPVVFSSTVDWLESKLEGDELTINVKDNPEGKLRSGKISWAYEYGNLSGEITVIQFGLSSLIGQYKFTRNLAGKGYYNMNDFKIFDGEELVSTAEITETELIIPDMEDAFVAHIPITMEETEGNYSITFSGNYRAMVKNPLNFEVRAGFALRIDSYTETSLTLKCEDDVLFNYVVYRPAPVPAGTLTVSNIRFESIPE